MAVYTEVNDVALLNFLEDYDIGDVISYQGIAEGAENSNFLLQTTHGHFILTLYEKRVDPADIPFFLSLMSHLAARGIKCPLPVKGVDGESLHTLENRPAAIITFLEGSWPRHITSKHCLEVGRAMANMHDASASFKGTRSNSLSIQGWRALSDSLSNTADSIAVGLKDEIEIELSLLEREWPQTLPSGVIHADLFPDNVFFLGDRCSGLIDFYFACSDFLAYDIAVCLNAWCFELDGTMNVTKAEQLLLGYESVRPLIDDEKLALPVLTRGSAMRFLLTRLFDWINVPAGTLVKTKDPAEYLQKLRFHQEFSSIGNYGLS